MFEVDAFQLALACVIALGASTLGGLSGFGTGLILPVFLLGLLIGLFTAPGAFLARAILKRTPAGIHAGFMEVIVVAGAPALLWKAHG